MDYIAATPDMADDIYKVLHTTIKTIYPQYYPREVVDFFCQHHNKEHILAGIVSENMGVLVNGDAIVGTGCYDGNHITGVYVLLDYQKQGCGLKIMNWKTMLNWFMRLWKRNCGLIKLELDWR